MRFYLLLKGTFDQFIDDNCPSMAAALAYYTAFSLPPLLVIIISVLGWILDPQEVKGEITRQIGGVIGPEAAQQLQLLGLENVDRLAAQGSLAAVLGAVALLFGATSAFAQLQAALNITWSVKPDPAVNTLKHFLLKRVLSFGMIAAIGFLLLISLTVSTTLAAFGQLIEELLSTSFSNYVFQLLDILLSFAISVGLFAALFKFIPDARVFWRDAWIGAAFTGLLFTLGKFLIGLYLANSDVANAYGAAGSFALILLWIYYSSLIVLLGAEFTEAWAAMQDRPIQPHKGAVLVVTRTEHYQPPDLENSQQSL